MLDNLKDYRIFLASKSPRRQALLSMLDIPYSMITLEGIDESYPEDLPAEEVALHIAKKKADGYKIILTQNDIIITADTIVICDNQILGKPEDEDEAKKMLHLLSGKTHTVSTGVAITSLEKQVSFSSFTNVKFGSLSDDEINYYVDSYEPLDKAGAYGIQEWISAAALEKIDGCFYNVMGLPLHELYKRLKEF